MVDTDYAKRLKARFKRRLEELDLQIRTVDYSLAMPILSISKLAKSKREHLRRGRKQLAHKRRDLLKEIKQIWSEYKRR